VTPLLPLPLHVETLGLQPGPDVDTVLLIHGFGGSAFSWRYWAPRLAARAHVVLVDLKGSGSAPTPDDGQYAPADQAELIHELVRQRDLYRVTLVGHSLGGGIALITALRLMGAAEQRLHRLVVVAGAAYKQRLPAFAGFAKRARLSTMLFRLLGARFVIRRVLKWIVYDPSAIRESQVEGYSHPLRSRGTLRALTDSALSIIPPDIDELAARYPELDVPTLLLWGRHDQVVPLWVGERLAEEIPGARLEVLEACGHMPAEELPDESWDVLEGFLDEASGDP
jgi:pimeloyl-ACP methyl ester carboxylesterase